MKRFLFSLLTLVVAAVCGFSASAQDWSTTVKWEIPGSIQIKKGTAFGSATPVEIPVDATEITLTEATGYFVLATDGYAITSGDLDGTKKTPGLVDYSSGVKGISIRAQYDGDKKAYNGKTLVVTAIKLEYKPFDLEVANGASGITFKFYNNGSEVSTLSGVTDGNNHLEYPSTANQLFIQSSSYPRTALYSVQLEGVDQAEYNSIQHSYLVTLTEGCNIYVAKEDPASFQTYDVTFKFANNNPNIVATIRNWDTNKFIYPEEFGVADYKLTMPAGGEIAFNWNEEATITSLTQNGTDVAIKGGTKFAITENTEFVITGAMTEYAEKTVELYLVNEDHATFTANGEPLAMTFVKNVPANTVTLSSGYTIPVDCKLYEAKVLEKKNAGVSFDVNKGYWIKNAIRGTLTGAFADAKDLKLDGTSKINLENMPLFLNVAQINNTATAYVYYDGPENSGMLQSKSPDGIYASYEGESATLAKGWTEIKFDPEYNSDFTARISITFDNQNWVKTVVLDGTAVEADDYDNFNMPSIGNNSVLKMFFTPVATPAYYTTLEVGEKASAQVTYDNCKVIDLTETTKLTNYGPTPFVIHPAANVVVKIDDVEKTPDAEGLITLTATKKSTISFELKEEDNQTIDINITPESGSTLRKLQKFSFALPFDGEHSVWYDQEKLSEITLTDASGNVVSAEDVAAGMSDTEFPITILFPAVTTAGEYTLHIPGGFFYQTVWDDAADDFAFQPGCQATKELTATYTVDPTIPLKYSFTPANGSVNEFPEDGQFIIISIDDAETLEEAETTGNGPWVTFNGVNIKKVDDPDAETGWAWMQTFETWGKPALGMYISQSVFTSVGTLEITADANAFIVDGVQESPELAYSAQFGEKREYDLTFSPEAGSSVPNVKPEFKITFEGAESIKVDENNFDAYFRMGLTNGVQIFPRMTTVEGNTITIQTDNNPDNPFAAGNYTLEILAGSLIIDGNQPNDYINVGYVIERQTETSQAWTPNPTTGCVNYGSGMGVAFVFGEEETVTAGSTLDKIKVTFDGTELVPYDPSLDAETMWYRVEFDDYMPYLIMISASGGKISQPTTSGELTVILPAGAVNISGEPLAEQAEHTWKLLAAREYAWEVDPKNGSSIKELSSITISFPDAETVTLSEYFAKGWINIKKGFSVMSNAKSVTEVEGAEHPTFLIEFETPATASGEYRVSIGSGSFLLDGVFENDPISLDYIVDSSMTGVDGIFAADGLFTIVSTQGIVLMRNVDAETLRTLPAGLYIINNRKVNIR